MTEQTEKRKRGRPQWTEEQKQAARELNAKKREERERMRDENGEKPFYRTRGPWTDEERKLRAERLAQKKAAQAAQKATEGTQEPVEEPKKPFDRRKITTPRNAQKSPEVMRKNLTKTPEGRAIVSRLMLETVQSYNKPRVKTDDELAARFAEFYQECAETGKIPTIEELYLSTGYGCSYMQQIENGNRQGFTPETKHIIKRAREFMKTFDAKLAVTGEVNPIVYFFRAKNYYDMRDQQEIVVNSGADRVSEMSDEDIKKWYLEDGKQPVETTFADEEGGG